VAIWKLVHILAMFGAFGLVLTPLFVFGYVGRRGDLAAVAGVLQARKRLSRAAVPLFLLGLVAGWATMTIAGLPVAAPWLVATYALIVLYGVWDALVVTPWERRLERALAADDKTDEGTLLALARSRRPSVGAWGGVAAVVAIEALMVLKPTFGL
jgi:uncharacterized membrane protein